MAGETCPNFPQTPTRQYLPRPRHLILHMTQLTVEWSVSHLVIKLHFVSLLDATCRSFMTLRIMTRRQSEMLITFSFSFFWHREMFC